MLARVVRVVLAAVAWSGLWAVVLATGPTLWTEPTSAMPADWELMAGPGGRLYWRAERGDISRTWWYDEDSRPCGSPFTPTGIAWSGRPLDRQIPVARPIAPIGPRVVFAGGPHTRSAVTLSGVWPERESNMEALETWYLVTDASRRRFHLVGYHGPKGEHPRPVIWFARGGYLRRPPTASQWFEATSDPEDAVLSSGPDPRFRVHLDRRDAWPQDYSLLLLADGGLLSADLPQHRWRQLIAPCGLDRVAETGTSTLWGDVDPEGHLPRIEREVAARAGDELYLLDRATDGIRRFRLPASLHGQAGSYRAFDDGTMVASPSGARQPDTLAGRTVATVWFTADGWVLKERCYRFAPPRSGMRAQRAALVAACPLGLLWPGTAQPGDAGVPEGLALAARVNVALALVVLAASRQVGWALANLLLGLPGAAVWMMLRERRRHQRRTGPPRWSARCWPLLALARKDLLRLAPVTLLATAIVLRLSYTQGLRPLRAAADVTPRLAGNGLSVTDGNAYLDALSALLPSVVWLGIAFAAWVAWRQVADENWRWLLGQRVDRQRAVRAKLVCGLLPVALVGWLPAVVVTVALRWPGVVPGPVPSVMLAPIWRLGPMLVATYLCGLVLGWFWLEANGRASRALLGRLANLPGEVTVALLVSAGLAVLVLAGTPPSMHQRPRVSPFGDHLTEAVPRFEVSDDDRGRTFSVSVGITADGTVRLERGRGWLTELTALDGRGVGDGPNYWVFVPAPRGAADMPREQHWIEPLGHDQTTVWHLICGPATVRRYYLAAYDRASHRPVGWLTRNGFVTQPPVAATWFDLADGGLALDHSQPEWRFVVADRGRVRRLGRRESGLVAELPGMTAFSQPYSAGVIARSGQQLRLPADGALPAAACALPPSWGGGVYVTRLANGQLVARDPQWTVPDSLRLVWLEPDGQVGRSVVVDRASGARWSEIR